MGIASNIWKLQADRFLCNFWIYISILVPFFESHGLNATQIFITETVFALVVATTEIPTGYISDKIGRKKCFMIGSAFIPLGISCYAFFDHFYFFILGEALLGLGISFRSGTDSSFLYDTLAEIKREDEHKKLEGTAQFFNNAGSAVANIMGGFLAKISLVLPFYINIAVSFLMVPLAASMQEPKREAPKTKKGKAHLKDIRRAIKYSMRHKTIWNATIYAAFTNGLGLVGYWLFYIYYNKIGINVAYFGFLAAAGSFSSAMGGKMLYRIDKRFGERIALSLPLLMGLCLSLIGLMQSVWAIPLIMCNAFLWGLSAPLLRNVVHKNTRSSIRATVMSLSNMGGRVVFVLLSTGFGYLVDSTSVFTSLTCLGVLLPLTTARPAWKLVQRSRTQA